MSDNNQASFMRTVRAALGHPRTVPRQAPDSLFHGQPSPNSQRLLEGIQNREPAGHQVLIEKLMAAASPIKLDVTVVASPEEAAGGIIGRIAQAPVEWGGPRKVCMWEHPLIENLGLESKLARRDIPVVCPKAFLQATGHEGTADRRQALRREINGSFVGVTGADFCVADTATLVLRTGPGQPRSISLVPSIHIAVITVEQILANFGELYACLRWGNAGAAMDLTTCMTFISGPSKTADIEATLVHGAHGPRSVWVYVIRPS